MTMIVLRLLSLLGLKSRWHRHFSPRPPSKVFFQGGGVSLDSWTLGPKPLCHRHPTGPHPSGLGWTPAMGEPIRSDVALALGRHRQDPRVLAVERQRDPTLEQVDRVLAEDLVAPAMQHVE